MLSCAIFSVILSVKEKLLSLILSRSIYAFVNLKMSIVLFEIKIYKFCLNCYMTPEPTLLCSS